MSALGDFHFLRPLWLLLLVPFAILCWRLFRHGDAAGIWQSVCDEALLPYLLVKRNAARNPVNPALLVAGGLLAIAALAGPTWERLPTPVFRDESALVILLDLSRSMNAEDVSPSRLERAKFKITDMLRLRREGQTALVVYAAEPYVVTPLTTDVATIESHLPALKTNIMPSQGSDAAAAIEKGIELLQQAGVASGDLILVTDGVDLDEGKRAAAAISGSSVRLSILGVGTTEGAPIPDQSGGFIADAAGAIVLKALDTSALDRLAAAGNGDFAMLRADDGDVNRLLDGISNRLNQRNAQSTDLFADRWREFGPWLLLALLPFAPLAFRRGVLVLAGAIVSAAILPATPAAAAWWQTPDQAAQAQFDAGDYAGAAETFDNPEWRAAANYRAHDFEAAVDNVAEDAGPRAYYNKGNALARLGRFEEAIEAYETTLAALPDDEDAQHNKALLEELLKEQQQQQESDSDGSDENENQDQNGESGGEQSNQRSDSKPSDSESQDSAEQDPGADEQSASTTSSEQESEAEAQAQEDEQTAEEQQIEADEAPADKAEEAFAAANSDLENEQATEQWLRQIPDDPGGLLRRKFEVEYQRKHGRSERRTRAW